MTLTYLVQTASVTLDVNGNGQAQLRPGVTEFWLPTFVRVSTVNQAVPYAQCTVFTGAPNTLDASTYLDDTFLGNRDTSSIITGQELQFGDAITAKWQNGQPGDTGILTVFGMLSDIPVTLSNPLPSAPGTHFAGHAPPAAGQVLLDLNQTNPLVLGATGQTIFGPFYVANLPAVFLRAKSLDNPCQIKVAWEITNPGPDVDSDVYTIGGSVTTTALERAFTPKTPWMELIVTAPTAVGCTVKLELTSAPNLRIPTADTSDIVVFNKNFVSINAGVTSTFEAPTPHVGHAYFSAYMDGTSGFFFALQALNRDGAVTEFFRFDDHYGGRSVVQVPLYVPLGRYQLVVFNGSAGAQHYTAYMNVDPWSGN